MHFANFDIDLFLSDYWQKKPLLIRNPWAAWTNPLDPDELAGLACEEDVESRLITQTSSKARAGWKLEHGPIPEARFGKLGKKQWTLLVQAVDHYVPAVAALIEPFRFIPNWRIDDVMVTYAADEGGVGAHFDQYDVFLIQGLGKRRWQVGAPCDSGTTLLPHDDLRLLADFQAIDEWILEPGDILYVPPRVAHNGVAVGNDCMTYSIGFRAPSRMDLIEGYCDHLVDEMQDDDRYEDDALSRNANPGEIPPAAIARLHAMLMDKVGDSKAFARWFGEYNSAPKYPEQDGEPADIATADDVRAQLKAGMPLIRNPASRFSFIRQSAQSLLLFVDGKSFDCAEASSALAERLCANDHLSVDEASASSEAAMSLIVTLLKQGSIAFDEI
jgi:50S ribosomal protein L16 3-hydroxylase